MNTPYKVEVFNMTLPPEGPGVIPITHDFDGVTTEIEIDLTQIVNDGLVSYISGVQIDAMDGAAGAVMLEANGTGQRVACPANVNLLWPVFVANPPKFTLTATGGYTGLVRLHFANFPIFYGATTAS